MSPRLSFVPIVFAVACGSSSNSSLFDNKPSGSGGVGTDAASGAGGTSDSGGSVGTGGGGGSLATGGATAGTGGLVDTGGSFGSGGTGGLATDAAPSAPDASSSGGAGGATDGAWAHCSTSADCTGGRVCTKTVQSLTVSGRPGACVQSCPFLGTSGCDTPPPGGTLSCINLLVASYCSITCPDSTCPAGMDCVPTVAGNLCFYSK